MMLTANYFIDEKKIHGKSCLGVTTMINFLKKRVQKFYEKFSQCEQICINTENEYLVMSCGTFNPRFLAKIKRSKASNNKK
jgi:hypothetical protein